MLSVRFVAILLLGVIAVHGSEFMLPDDQSRSNHLQLEGAAVVPDLPGPDQSAGPRDPNFFLGHFHSDPKHDWQINMYEVYNVTRLPVDYVTKIVNAKLTDIGNGSYRFMKMIGDDLVYNLTFRLNEPIVMMNTIFGDRQYTFSLHDSTLSILSNTSMGSCRTDLNFEGEKGEEGYALYTIFGKGVKGARHFRRVNLPTPATNSSLSG